MRALLYIGLLLTLLASCLEDEKVVYILFDNSEGLSVGQNVMLNGVSVGKVKNVDLTKDNEVITTVELSPKVDFPKGTLFEIQSKDLFTKIIHVTLVESNTMIQRGDTIQGIRTVNPTDQIPCSREKPKILDNLKEMLKN
jgi:phospholipid/cholesterol/gamma-HCH transport system substrate-binding protein